MSKTITIAGGGLAGLSLGIGLLNKGVPVRLLEAGSYPRHRVCGEFICGVDQSTLKALGIRDAFDKQVTNRDSRWFYGSRSILKRTLPKPAIGISRHHLDQSLAAKFSALGGELATNTRANEKDLPEESTVWAGGRQRSGDAQWIGLKCHVRKFGDAMDTDLQMHFGDRCYVGISKVENETANVCGLFQIRRDLKASERSQLLLKYLKASGLEALAEKLEAAEMLPDSLLGVSAFKLGHQPSAKGDRLHLGDTYSMIPPFTGNGMTMAFQSAELALPALTEYAHDSLTWKSAISTIREAHRKKFDRRVRWAMRLHPFLLNSSGQKLLVAAAKIHAVPFGLFFNKTR